MSPLIRALYTMVSKYQTEVPPIDTSFARYEFVLPLERGNGTKVMRGHYGDYQP